MLELTALLCKHRRPSWHVACMLTGEQLQAGGGGVVHLQSRKCQAVPMVQGRQVSKVGCVQTILLIYKHLMAELCLGKNPDSYKFAQQLGIPTQPLQRFQAHGEHVCYDQGLHDQRATSHRLPGFKQLAEHNTSGCIRAFALSNGVHFFQLLSNVLSVGQSWCSWLCCMVQAANSLSNSSTTAWAV